MFRTRFSRSAAAALLATATLAPLAATPAGAVAGEEDISSLKTCQGVTSKLVSLTATRGTTKLDDANHLKAGDKLTYEFQLGNDSYSKSGNGPTQFLVEPEIYPVVNGTPISKILSLTTNDLPTKQTSSFTYVWPTAKKNVIPSKQHALVRYERVIQPAEILALREDGAAQNHTLIQTITIPSGLSEDDVSSCKVELSHTHTFTEFLDRVPDKNSKNPAPPHGAPLDVESETAPGLSGGAIAGIVAGVLGALGLIGGIVWSLLAKFIR